MKTPRLYATFLLWMLAQLFDKLPEVGDLDEAEARVLLRRGAPAVQRGAQGAAGAGRARHAPDPLQGRRRLLRHAEPARRAQQRVGPARQPHPACAARLHAASSRRASAPPPRPSGPIPSLDTERVIQELKVGEALVSVLHDEGEPSMVQRTLIRPPSAASGPSRPSERKSLIEAQPDLRQVRGDGRPRLRLRDCCRSGVGAARAEAEANENSWGSILMGARRRQHRPPPGLWRDLHKSHRSAGGQQCRPRDRWRVLRPPLVLLSCRDVFPASIWQRVRAPVGDWTPATPAGMTANPMVVPRLCLDS